MSYEIFIRLQMKGQLREKGWDQGFGISVGAAAAVSAAPSTAWSAATAAPSARPVQAVAFDEVPERKLNPLQQVTYFGILNVLLPLQILTGILMWGAQRWPEIAARLGGLLFLAPFHTLVAWLFAAFLLMHLYLTTTGHTPTAHLKAMIDGWDEVPVAFAGDGAAPGDTPLRRHVANPRAYYAWVSADGVRHPLAQPAFHLASDHLGGLNAASFGQLHFYQQLGPVRGGEELLLDEAHAYRGQYEGSHHNAGYQEFVMYRPGNHAAQTHVVRGVVNGLVTARTGRNRRQQFHAHIGGEGHGNQPGRQQGGGQNPEQRHSVLGPGDSPSRACAATCMAAASSSQAIHAARPSSRAERWRALWIR